ncbi:MAG TPA: hypothetical protein VGD29_00450 [Actinoplanes sp.]
MTPPPHLPPRIRGAERLLAAAEWLLPAERGEWARAMRAELAALPPGRSRWVFAAGCLRAAVRSGGASGLARLLATVAAAFVLAQVTGATGLLRAGVIGVGLVAPVAWSWLGRRDALVGAVGPARAARVARRGYLFVLACCFVAGIETLAVSLPREGSSVSGSGAVSGLTLLVGALTGYAALGLAVTSATAATPGTTLAGAGSFGVAAGLSWCALMPFDQTLSLPGAWRVVVYGSALAVVVVAAPAAAALLAVRRAGDPGQGWLAGGATGGLAALVILAGGWTTVRFAPWLLSSPLLDKGPQWRPPDVVEQVITSYLVILALAPVIGALIGWLTSIAVVPPVRSAEIRHLSRTTVRCAAVAVLVIAGFLVYPGVNAAVAGDRTAFGEVGTTAIVFSPAGGTLLTSNGDNTWILWSVADPSRPRRLATFNGDALYSRDGRLLVSPGVVWSLNGAARPVRTAGFGGGQPVALSSGGGLLATRGTPATTTLWRITGHGRPHRLGTIAEGGSGVFSPDGRTFVVRGDNSTALWDVTDPARPVRLARLAGTGSGPLSPDGRILTTTTDDGVVLWNLANPAVPERIGVLAGPGGPDSPGDLSDRVVYSPDSRTVAVGDREGGVTLFDTSTGVRTASLAPAPGQAVNTQIGASDTLTTMAWAPDGRDLSVVTGNDTVSVWDLTDPRGPVRARVLTRHTDGAGQVAFSPDAGIVAGAAVDGSNSITLWRLR